MRKYLAVEIDPPASCDLSFFLEAAGRARDAGADAVTLADNPFARARADSAILACKLRRETGVRAIPHLTCRDRNYNAIKSALYALAAEGVDEVLAVTGDPVRPEDRENVKTRASFGSAGLAAHIAAWNRADFARPFSVSCALNVNAPNFRAELARAAKKAESGATSLYTQPVLGRRAAENVRLARAALPAGIRLVAGILPVVSAKNAAFLDSSMRGIRIERDIADRYAGADRERGTELAIDVSLEMMGLVADSVDGFCVITPFSRIDIVEGIIARAAVESDALSLAV